MNAKKRILLHLSLISGVGPATIIKIINGLFLELYPELQYVSLMETIEAQEHLHLEKLYTFTVYDFVKICGLIDKTARIIVLGLSDQKILEQECLLIDKHNIRIVSILDSEYPEILKQIHLPPIILYCRGRTFLDQAKRISIVGSRKADQYAQNIITALVPDLVAQGWHIVSGGAEGADSMAHRATLDAGGITLVVFGSGFLHPYPTSNIKLFEEVIQNDGILVTPFSLNTPPDKTTFPARNRIVSGLSHGCVVVRAAAKSGALITAQFALEQGRHVFAVPGSINDDLSLGCHNLIQQGAKLVNNSRDILEDFGQTIAESLNTTGAISRQTSFVGVKKDIDPVLQVLTDIYTLDELSFKTNLDLDTLQQKLFELQLEGKVRQTFTGSWEKSE